MTKPLLMMLRKRVVAGLSVLMFAGPIIVDASDSDPQKSVHYGFLSSTGADLIGWETKSAVGGGLYTFYSFGFPSMVTGGLALYSNYHDEGIIFTAGVGLGTLLNTSISYQWKMEKNEFFELGVGYGLFFEGQGPYPVISYVVRK